METSVERRRVTGKAILTVAFLLTSGALSTIEAQDITLDPAANSHVAPTNTNLTVTTSGIVNQSTVDSTTFVVHAGFRAPVNGTFSFPINSIVFDPDLDFHPGELVSTTLTAGIEVDSIPMDPYVWRFRTIVGGGTGLFDNTQLLGSSRTNRAELGDLDGDGDLDALAANWPNAPNIVWLNNGNGSFSAGQNIGSKDSEGVVLGDLDGDGDLDAVFSNRSNQPNDVWMNDGTGTFTDSGQNLGNSSSLDLAIGDLDGDGDLDVFVVNNGGNKVWLNDGTGTFSDNGQNLGNTLSLYVALGDLDGDGDLDAFVANGGNNGNKVWLNDGIGNFSESGQSLGSSNSYGVALGDIDGDGDLDALVANGNPPQPNKVYRNEGTGTFTEIQSLGDSYTRGVALGDLDGDCDLDAFDANRGANEVWMNTGTGTFSSTSQSLGDSTSNGVNVALGDLDGEGDLDAFVAGGTYRNGQNMPGPNEVWINRDCGVGNQGQDRTQIVASIFDYNLRISPNPFTSATTVEYSIPRPNIVGLRIYDLTGRLVRTLVDAKEMPGYHSLEWNGTDDHGDEVPNGIYFCKLTAGGMSATRKMVVLR